MIELKRCNYITGDHVDVSLCVNEIVNFLELYGRNVILFTKSTNLKYFLSNKIDYKSFDNFKSIINTRGVLFKIDLIIIDLWGCNISDIFKYKSVIDGLHIDYIIIAKEYYYKTFDDVTDFHIKRESIGSSFIGYKSQFTITDRINGWSADLHSLSKSFIRNIKINGIIEDLVIKFYLNCF